jgi:hypothetical protein
MPGYLLDHLRGLLNDKAGRDLRSAGNAFVNAAATGEPPTADENAGPSGGLCAWLDEKLGPVAPARIDTRLPYRFDNRIGLSNPEEEELKGQFGWSRDGLKDKDAAWRAGLLDGWGFYRDANNAQSKALKLNIPGCEPGVNYSGEDASNDCRDAYRHAYWSALMAQRDEPSAKEQGDAHERTRQNPYQEHYMDLYNNRVGRAVGAAHPYASRDKIDALIAEQLANGCLITSPEQVPPLRTKTPPSR